MNILNLNNSLNFGKVYRKVHTREPILVQEIIHPYTINNNITYCTLRKTIPEIEMPNQLSEFQAATKAIEYERLLAKQQIARNRSGNIFTRLKQMEEFGYEGICKNIDTETLCALTSLKKETIAALNDSQIYRICEIQDGKRKTSEGLLELEKEFSSEELQRISERDGSTIINSWINNKTLNENGFENLTKYIHHIARK